MQNSSYQNKILKTGQGFDVTLATLLGEGATAYTYLGRNNNDGDYVAIKIAKLGQNDFLEGEYKILEAARQYYLKTKGADILQPSPAPVGDGSFEGQYFIVMEYLTGKPALHVLDEKKKLSEEQVLSCAVELFEFLDFLHVDRNVIYSDFKFDNLRIDENTNILRILDLGGMPQSTETDDPKRKRDVLVMASALFTLLSGMTFQLFAGEVTEEIETALKDDTFKKNVSWGTTRFFSRLLARVPEFRLDSAQSAAEEAKELHHSWRLSESDLLREAMEYSDKADEAKSAGNIEMRNVYLAKQRKSLDIFIIRFGNKTPQSKTLQEQLEKVINATSYLENGKTDLLYGQYESAIRKFREGATFEGDPAQFRRWQYLARVLEELKDSTLLPLAQEVADLFNEKKYREASQKADSFPMSVNVEDLKHEAKIYLSYQLGQQLQADKQFDSAIKEYQNVESLLISFKDSNAIEREEGSPQKLQEECRRAKVELEKQGEYEQIFEKMKSDLVSSGSFFYDDLRQFVSVGKFFSRASLDSEKLIVLALDHANVDYVSVLAETLFWEIAFKSDTLRNLYRSCRDLAYLRMSIDMGRLSNDPNENELGILKSLSIASTGKGGIIRQINQLLLDMVNKNYAPNNLFFWEGVKTLVGKENKKLMMGINSHVNKIKTGNKSRSAKRFEINWKKAIIFPVAFTLIVLGIVIFPKIAAGLSPATLTATPSPTETFLPTETPSPPPTLAPTATPTMLPQSDFLITDVKDIFDPFQGDAPKLPVVAEGIWRLPMFVLCEDDGTQYCATMDRPLEIGKYGIYIHQHPQNLGTRSQPVIPFEVKLQFMDSTNALQTESIAPSLGPGKIQLASLNEVSIFKVPAPTTWVWVGNYDFNQVGVIKIEAGPFDDASKIDSAKIFDKVVLVKLDEAQWKLLPTDLDGYKLVTVLDDTNLYQEDLSSLTTPIALSNHWNGTGAIAPKGEITFTGSGALQPGTYKALYHITAEGSGEMKIKIRTGTGSIENLELAQSYPIDPNNPWLDLGDFTLSKAAQILFEVTNVDAGINIIPVDVILIYQKITP